METIEIRMRVVVREAVERDLGALEWRGEFASDRRLIRRVYEEAKGGRSRFFVAEVSSCPIGQAWVDLSGRSNRSAGFLWAVRVMPEFQGRGIGSRLIARAEESIRDSGLRFSEISVEQDNPGALRLYQNLDYGIVGMDEGTNRWLLRKRLCEAFCGRRRASGEADRHTLDHW